MFAYIYAQEPQKYKEKERKEVAIRSQNELEDGKDASRTGAKKSMMETWVGFNRVGQAVLLGVAIVKRKLMGTSKVRVLL